MTLTTRAAYPQFTDYTYDSLDRVTDVRYPAEYGNPDWSGQPRKVVHQDFDVASRLSGLKVDGVSQASSIVYNPASQTTSLKVSTGTNQITESYAYEALTGLLSNQKVQRGTTTLLDLSYNYLRAGTTAGRTGQLTKITNNLDSGKDRAYEYDSLGRLKKATGGSTSSWTQTYVYDRYGNRTSVTATGTADDGTPIPRDGFAALAFSATTNRISTAGWQYDAAGNQVRAQNGTGVWQRYQYDAANRLVKVKADNNTTVLASYTYGDSNVRLITDESGYRTYYVSEGGTVIAEYSETPALPTTPKWSKSYVYLGGRLLSTLTPNGSGGEAVNYHHPDRLGTRLVTDPVAGTSFEQVTLPFGTPLDAESTGASNRRFTSYDRSDTTGLDYALNRHYDAQQGRFTQVDPIGMSAASIADPQSFNRYAYTKNDPVNFTDPSGLCSFSVALDNQSSISADQLQAMKDRISGIFGAAGQQINFLPANARGADFNLTVYSSAAGHNEGSTTVGSTDLVSGQGSPVTRNGRVYVDRLTNSATATTSGRILFPLSPNFLGFGLGTAGAHEIGHRLLQQRFDSNAISGIMHAGFTGVEWFGAIRTFNAAQIMLLNSRCAPVTTDTTVPNTSPTMRPVIGGGGGGGFGGGGGYSGGGGFGGGGWNSFDLLYLMLKSESGGYGEVVSYRIN